MVPPRASRSSHCDGLEGHRATVEDPAPPVEEADELVPDPDPVSTTARMTAFNPGPVTTTGQDAHSHCAHVGTATTAGALRRSIAWARTPLGGALELQDADQVADHLTVGRHQAADARRRQVADEKGAPGCGLPGLRPGR